VNTCELCSTREGIKSAIVRGKYHRSICGECYEDLLADNMVSSGHADYERGRDAEEHESDIMQPLGPGGIPSAEFIKLYPDTAKKVFTPEEIHRAIRS
jgi:hypothetical protein